MSAGDDGMLEGSSEPDIAPTRERFGRYELVAELASGGMATVYLARLLGEEGIARVVALKRIHPHLARDRGFADMFLDEARIASRIDHPNVCQVLEFGRERGTSFLAMELLTGETLSRIGGAIARGGAPEMRSRLPALAATIVAEACDGLQAAHELQDAEGRPLHVVHRDVSPQNVIVTFDGGVKVVDFGIASAANKLHHTETGAVKGKLAYMAPEQLAGRVDARSDVWALGVVLWELLTVKRLFRRATPSETIAGVERDPIPPPSSVRPEIPSALDAVVMRALARDPAERCPSARELARDLRAVLRAEGDVIDRATIAEWMSALFPDGAERRRRWVELAERGASTEPVLDGTDRSPEILPAARSDDDAAAATRPGRRAGRPVVVEAAAPTPADVTLEPVATPAPAPRTRARVGLAAIVATAATVAIGALAARGAEVEPEPPHPVSVPRASAGLEAEAALAPPAIEAPPAEAAPEPPLEAAPESPLEAAPEPPLEAAPEPPLEAAPESPLEAAPEPVQGSAPRAAARRRARTGPATDTRASESAAPPPSRSPAASPRATSGATSRATSGESACLLVASGIRVRVAGTWHEGPLGPRQCIRVPAGAHELAVVDLVSGERLWSGRHAVEGGIMTRVTRTGLAR